MGKAKTFVKAGHRKTKTGCFKCRARRIKCDENKPTCINCQRLNHVCQYTEVSHPNLPIRETRQGPMLSELANVDVVLDSAFSPAQREQLKLKLIHAWMTRGLMAMRSAKIDFDWIQAFFIDLPALAFKHDNLLYALLAWSAQQLQASPNLEPEITQARDEFWSEALRVQSETISRPSADTQAVILAAFLIMSTAFGLIRERDLEPYTPPLAWYDVSHSADYISPDRQQTVETRDSNLQVLKTTYVQFTPISQFDQNTPIDDLYKPILEFDIEEEKQANPSDFSSIFSGYEKTLQQLTCFKKSVAAGDAPYLQQRWLWMHGQRVPAEYVDCLREMRPRALMVLACLWTILLKADNFVLRSHGDADGVIPRRELDALSKHIPQKWLGLFHMLVDDAGAKIG